MFVFYVTLKKQRHEHTKHKNNNRTHYNGNTLFYKVFNQL